MHHHRRKLKNTDRAREPESHLEQFFWLHIPDWFWEYQLKRIYRRAAEIERASRTKHRMPRNPNHPPHA